jgi:apolipoprotein N-acyltransferase
MLSSRYFLPCCSGILLALVFFPFYLWALAFVALTPFFYFAIQGRYSIKEVFVGGFIVGALGIGPLIYLSLANLSLFPDAQVFTWLVRASSVPVLLLVGILFGCVGVTYRTLYSRNAVLNVILGASLYIVFIEVPLFWIFDGYYYGALSHALVEFAPIFFAVALGGALLVSFLVAATSVALSEVIFTFPTKRRLSWMLSTSVLLIWGAMLLGYSAHLFGFDRGKMIPVSVIQGKFDDYVTGVEEEVIIYPYSLNDGIVTPETDRMNGAELAGQFASSVSVVLWQTFSVDGQYYDELSLWNNGQKSTYRKRKLYALSDDYTPAWLQYFGVQKNFFAVTPGQQNADNVARLQERAFGSLICSELHQVELARHTAAGAPFIISVGSDAMFPGPLSGDFSLAAARLRAAENGITVVRANILGPSAFVAPDGSLEGVLMYGQRGILRGFVPFEGYVGTLYAKTGSWPVYALVFATIAAAIALRMREQYLPLRSAR